MSAAEKLAAMLDGKTVAIVGNSTDIETYRSCPSIDGHEVVIRMNLGLPQVFALWPERGIRTTVWATAKFWNPGRWLVHPELGVFMKLSELGEHHWSEFQKKPPTFPMVRWAPDLESECEEFVGSSPSTGLRMTWFAITKCKPSLVTVAGFDHWKTPTNWSGRMNTPSHDPAKEAAAMRRLLGS